MKKYNYIYKIILTQGSLKGYCYYGKHSTDNLDDGYKGSGKMLKSYYKKYPEDYIKEIIAFYDSTNELNKAEKDIIEKHMYTNNCLNIATGGTGGDTFSNQTDERKQEINNKKSKSMLGKNKGKKCPESQKEYLSKINKGKKLSDETKEKMSIAHSGERNNWFNNPTYGFKGKHHTEETKKLISDKLKTSSYFLTDESRKQKSLFLKGRPKSEEHKQKISNALKGRKLSEETKQKIGKSCKGHISPNKGKKMSDEQRQKISNSAKGKHRVYDNEEHTKWHFEF